MDPPVCFPTAVSRLMKSPCFALCNFSEGKIKALHTCLLQKASFQHITLLLHHEFVVFYIIMHESNSESLQTSKNEHENRDGNSFTLDGHLLIFYRLNEWIVLFSVKT